MTTSLKEDNRPSQQWYWDDWFSAFDVRLCSLAARGLWIDMLGIMFKAEIRGTLMVNGKQINSKTLAKIIGEDEGEIRPLLKELEDNEVFSRISEGIIICRRMLNESKKKDSISRIRSEAGKKGADQRWRKMAKNGKTKKRASQNDGKLTSRNDSKGVDKSIAKMATSSSSPTSSSKSKDTLVNEIESKWNTFAEKHGLPLIKGIPKNSKRWRYLNTRTNDEDFNFDELLELISQQPFLLGQETRFRATFDWILNPSNYMKIMEGNYTRRPDGKAKKPSEMTPEEYTAYQDSFFKENK